MTTQAETHELPGQIGLPKEIFRGFHKAKDFLNTTNHKAVDITSITSDSVKSITTTVQQAKASLRETIDQTKASLEQTLQATGQIKNTTSEVIQTAINSSVSDWLQAHPVAFRLVQMLLWATNHPILSLVILLFTIAIAWTLIKAIGRLIETASLSLLKVPFTLSMVLIRSSSQILYKFGGSTFKQLPGAKNSAPPVLQHLTHQPNHKDKQQRLAEISQRLQALQKEHNELLQEAATIITINKS